jgi:hypothetical protein
MPFVITEACVDVNDRRCLTECPVEPSGGAELAGVARHDHAAVAALAGRQSAGTPETGGN